MVAPFASVSVDSRQQQLIIGAAGIVVLLAALEASTSKKDQTKEQEGVCVHTPRSRQQLRWCAWHLYACLADTDSASVRRAVVDTPAPDEAEAEAEAEAAAEAEADAKASENQVDVQYNKDNDANSRR